MAGFLTFTRERTLNKVVEIEVSRIVPNPNQPRREFADGDISCLADSIAQNGILQPIAVRKNGEVYELIAGDVGIN